MQQVLWARDSDHINDDKFGDPRTFSTERGVYDTWVGMTPLSLPQCSLSTNAPICSRIKLVDDTITVAIV